MLRLLFGADGLAVTGDEVVSDNRTADVQQYVNMYCPQVEDYIRPWVKSGRADVRMSQWVTL